MARLFPSSISGESKPAFLTPRRVLSIAFFSALAIAPVACGGDPPAADDLDVGDGDGDGSGDDLGTDGGTPGGPPLDGGTKELTPQQVDQIKNAECSGYNGEAEPAPAILEFIVDVSGSMRDPAPGGGGSKWDVTRAALLDALDGLSASMAVGLQLFPTAEPGPMCVESVGTVGIEQLGAPGSAHRRDLADRINRAPLYNCTPTHDGYRFALTQSLEPYAGEGKKFMLLITDGAPTLSLDCMGDGRTAEPTDPIVAEIAQAHGNGIGTFVVGSPGSERSTDGDDMRPWLSAAAREGGTPRADCSDSGPTFCHFDMSAETDFATALTEGLRDITGSVSNPCSFEIPSDAPSGTIDASKTNVIIEWGSAAPELVIRDDQGDCSEGWRVADNGQLELCGATCDRIKNDAAARVTLSFGCMSGEVPEFE